jgi:hypothetical protein
LWRNPLAVKFSKEPNEASSITWKDAQIALDENTRSRTALLLTTAITAKGDISRRHTCDKGDARVSINLQLPAAS